jgi:hypothetical protein
MKAVLQTQVLKIVYEETSFEGGERYMRSVNKVILVGNVTWDPELKHTENKKSVCSFGLATNRN